MIENRSSRPADGSGPADSVASGSHRRLLFLSCLLTTLCALVVGGYGIWRDLFVLRALAWNVALTALTVGVCLHADRLRRTSARDAMDGERLDSSARPRSGRRLEWDDDQDDEEGGASRWDVEHARKLHYLFLAVLPTAFLMWWTGRELWHSAEDVVGVSSTESATALALLCLAASCPWLVFARSYQAIPPSELPDAPALGLAFREIQGASWVAAVGLFTAWLWDAAPLWAGRAILSWVLIVECEQLGRLAIGWLRPPQPAQPIPPWQSVAREAVFVHGNPLRSLFDGLEARWGVSFRSSWALRFVRRSVVPTALLVVLLLWGLSSLSIVQIDELGVREHWGCVQAAPLSPGLHWKLPWPFGRVLRYPVKRVTVKPIGFVSSPGRQSNYLWSKKHAQEEFSLVLGNGTELVAIDCVVYYKIDEDPQGFLQYVYQCQNPEDALEAFAYRTLTEQTRGITLRDVLTVNRAQFSERLQESLEQCVEANHLGLEVVDVALIGLHPPVEVAADFLDVISARIDCERVQVEALGEAAVQSAEVEQESGTAIASARVEAARRTGEALRESSQFIAIGQAYAVAPESYQLRIWLEALEEILSQKRFVLIDKDVAAGSGGILLDQRRQTTDGDDPVPLTQKARVSETDDLSKQGLDP
jgi:membrane protease subunit HflK